jgi:membrane associated rhomboid family serine protease
MFLSIPPVTRTLIIINLAVFLLQEVAGDVMLIWFALWPLQSLAAGPVPAVFQPWQLISYGFLHGSIVHLLFNMLGLYMFGSDIERVFGQRRYLVYYFTCVVTAGLAQLVVLAMSGGSPYPTLGASGGVFGVLLAFGMYFPRRIVVLIFPPIPMPAWLFVIIFGALELYLGITQTMAGVAHFAHLGGMLGGYLMIQYWRGRPPFRRRG